LALYDTINAGRGAPGHVSMDYSHGRIIKRSIWVTAADGIDFPHAAQVLRIRRDAYDLAGAAIAKEIVHGITSLDTIRGTPAALTGLTRGQWGIELVHWLRSPGVPKLLRDVAPDARRRAFATRLAKCGARCRC
jgi:hypothetical protein